MGFFKKKCNPQTLPSTRLDVPFLVRKRPMGITLIISDGLNQKSSEIFKDNSMILGG